jgi:outer membrane protein OmpA-like peptidoglycan-associated protein
MVAAMTLCRFLISLFFGLTLLGLSASASPVARSTDMQPIDAVAFRCEDYLPSQSADASWQGMMEVEHCDRIKRLAALTHTGARPEFFVQHIPKERLPSGFSHDAPLLRVVFPERVFFDTAQATLRAEGLEVARIVADSLRKDVPDVTLFVAGHTDARGDRDYNQNLSVDRANIMAAAILQQDVRLAQVWRIGFGPDMPLVPNGPEGWGFNRRVEFLFSSSPDAIAVWLSDMQLDGLCKGTSREQTSGCKKSLNLRGNYEATQLQLKPSSRQAVHPARKTTGVSPDSAKTAIQPQVARRIVINPVHRTYTLNL